MRTSLIGYPYWENIARATEDTQILLLIARILVLICPAVTLLGLLIYWWKHRKWTMKRLCLAGVDKIREKREERWEEKRRMKEEDAAFDDDREPVEDTEELENSMEQATEAAGEQKEDEEPEDYIDITPEEEEPEPELKAVTDEELFRK